MNNEEKILSVLGQLTDTVSKLDTRMDKLDTRMDKLEERMDSMQEQMGSMQKQMGSVQEQMGSMQETLTRVAITQENVVLPRIQLLAEGQTTILDKMPSKSRIEALEEDVSTLKAIIKFHAADIAELKAAK